jgi:ribonuclease HI
MMIKREVKMFTGSACRGDPSPVYWGALLRSGKTEKELWSGELDTSNNRMELASAFGGLEALNRASIIVLTNDSEYVGKGAAERVEGWKNGILQPVKSRDLCKRLDELSETHKINWRWVKGHSGHLENKRADARANRGIYELGEGGCDK